MHIDPVCGGRPKAIPSTRSSRAEGKYERYLDTGGAFWMAVGNCELAFKRSLAHAKYRRPYGGLCLSKPYGVQFCAPVRMTADDRLDAPGGGRPAENPVIAPPAPHSFALEVRIFSNFDIPLFCVSSEGNPYSWF